MTTVDDPSYRLGLALAEVSRLWRHVLDGRLKPLGLSTARWVALVNLSAHPEGMTQNALALRVGIKGSTLVRQLDLLEADGWVVRRAQPGDRRVKRVFLTPKAHPALASIAAVGPEGAVIWRERNAGGIGWWGWWIWNRICPAQTAAFEAASLRPQRGA